MIMCTAPKILELYYFGNGYLRSEGQPSFSQGNTKVFTVKPTYKDHPRETRKVVFIGRWSLNLCTGSFRTCFNEKPFSRETKNVVFVDR